MVFFIGIKFFTELDEIRRSLGSGMEQAQTELEQVRDMAGQCRLLAVSGLSQSLERAVRDVAQEEGKQVTYKIVGVDEGAADILIHGRWYRPW